MDILKIRGLILFIIAFLNLILALILWKKAKNDKAKFWLGLTAFFSALYSLSCGGTYYFWQNNSILSIYWHKSTWLGVFMLPPFNMFIYHFTERTKNLKLKSILFFTGAIAVGALAMGTYLLEKQIYFDGHNIVGIAGQLNILGRAYILCGLVIALFNIFKGYFQAEKFKKTQLKYLVLGTTLFAVAGIVFTSVVPLFTGVSSYYDLAAYFSFFWVAFIAYAVLKYNLFDIRIFASELLTFGVWILLFTRIVLSENIHDLLINVAISIALIIIGVLFLKSIYKETELNKKLLEESQKNLEFEKKLKKTYAQIAEKEIKSKYFR